MNKKPLCISIDFEDIYNDYLLRLNLDKNYIVREEALFKSYKVIRKILFKYFKNNNLTFFTTGILAEKVPDLIKEIYRDGNEIACHHYYQDEVQNSSNDTFDYNLKISKSYLTKAIGDEVIGYRAPSFSINHNVENYTNIISKYFKYDSSIYFNSTDKKISSSKINALNNLKEFYIYTKQINLFGKLIQIKPGGTYFRLMPKRYIRKFLDDSYKYNILPIIYLHPYDFLFSREFWIEFEKFNKINSLKKYFYFSKQIMWHSLGNNTVEKKLSYISRYFEHIGNMKENLKNF